MKTQQEQREQRRRERAAAMECEVRDGSLVVRQMTEAERVRYPPRGPAKVGFARLDPVERERARRLAELETEDRYRRERYSLYRAKAYGPRPTSETRLRDLKLASERAEERLRHA